MPPDREEHPDPQHDQLEGQEDQRKDIRPVFHPFRPSNRLRLSGQATRPAPPAARRNAAGARRGPGRVLPRAEPPLDRRAAHGRGTSGKGRLRTSHPVPRPAKAGASAGRKV